MNYTGFTCPVCSEKFKDGEDVVVCPICGTPHHRDCWMKENRCANEYRHSEGFIWQAPVYENNEGNSQHDNGDVVYCSRCGQPNRSSDSVCIRCGTPLLAPSGDGSYNRNAGGSVPPFGNMPPFGNANPGMNAADAANQARAAYSQRLMSEYGDVTVEGIPLIDVSEYTQQNDRKYISSFLKLTGENRKSSWNWASALFSVFWCLYRKMTFVGYIALAVFMALQFLCGVGVEVAYEQFAPETFAIYEELENSYEAAIASATTYADLYNEETMNTIMAMSQTKVIKTKGLTEIGITLLFGLFWGFMGDRLYLNRFLKDVKKARQFSADEHSYRYFLHSAGGASAVSVIFPVALLLIFSFI